MARRKKQGLVEDLFEIGAKLPWQVGVALAIGTFVLFHLLASLPLIPVATSNLQGFSQSIGTSVGRQLLVTISSFLQYIVPFGLLLGVGVSLLRRRRHQQLHDEVSQNPTRSALENVTWQEFEGIVAESFRQKGYRVTLRGGNGPDGGVDVELHMGHDKYLVQCKQWKVFRVGVATVRELYGVMVAERAVGGFVVTSGTFTDEALAFTMGREIHLVDATALLKMIAPTRTAPVESPETPIPACPKCGSPMVRREAKKGSNTGGVFWGCSRFPACRGIRN